MSNVLRGVEALMSAVLAHGTDPYAILEGGASNFQWGEKLGNRLSGRLWVNSTARARVLLGREERAIVGSLIESPFFRFYAGLRLSDAMGVVYRHRE